MLYSLERKNWNAKFNMMHIIYEEYKYEIFKKDPKTYDARS